jgi:hypothetical protein
MAWSGATGEFYIVNVQTAGFQPVAPGELGILRHRAHGTALHLARAIRPGRPPGSMTLCGRIAVRARELTIFSPDEVTCRECRRRWEIATGRR